MVGVFVEGGFDDYLCECLVSLIVLILLFYWDLVVVFIVLDWLVWCFGMLFWLSVVEFV